MAAFPLPLATGGIPDWSHHSPGLKGLGAQLHCSMQHGGRQLQGKMLRHQLVLEGQGVHQPCGQVQQDVLRAQRGSSPGTSKSQAKICFIRPSHKGDSRHIIHLIHIIQATSGFLILGVLVLSAGYSPVMPSSYWAIHHLYDAMSTAHLHQASASEPSASRSWHRNSSRETHSISSAPGQWTLQDRSDSTWWAKGPRRGIQTINGLDGFRLKKRGGD